MVVDDIKQNRYFLQKLLEGYDYVVETAKNGVEALEKAQERPPDMIITDVLMPGMDGFQLCRTLKNDDALKNIPVLFYSATYSDKKSRELALSIGAVDYIIKPIEPDEFIKIIREILGKYGRGELKLAEKPLEEHVYMKLYNEQLIKKLEKKMLDLENTSKILKESEQKYRELVDNANDVVMIIEPTGYLSFVNPKFSETFGYTMEEAKKLHISKLFHHENSTIVTETFRKKLSGEETHGNCDFLALTRSGETIYIDCNTSLIKREGEIVGIQVIVRDITERKRAEDHIKISLKEKEMLLQEIHHRVRNNLQIISSLLTMQARDAKNIDIIDIFTESRDRIDTMALVHSQLCESKNLSEINMKRFVERLIRLKSHIYSVQYIKITPIIHIADFSLPISIAVPLGLIVNELLSNAFKHAFIYRKKGRIEVSLRVSEKDVVSLVVCDDGIGLPEGYDIKASETLGLRLVKILVEDQLQGNIEVISQAGSTFNVQFTMETDEKEVNKTLFLGQN